MGKQIAMIPIDKIGNILFLSDLRVDNNRIFVCMKSTYNDIPLTEVELYPVDSGANCAICGDDGTVLYRFSTEWLKKISVADKV